MRSLAAGALMLAAIACSRIVDPPLDARAVPLEPPAVYARWWEMTKSCSGLEGSLSDITWYQVPRVETVKTNVSSYWSAASNQIVLAGNVILNGSVVRHEMLHALLRVAGHSRLYFLARCGGFVSCNATCVNDAGPAPSIGSGIAQIKPADLAITAVLIPSHPTSSVDDGVFGLRVTATNTSNYPVLVVVDPVTLSQMFWYSFISAGTVVASASKQNFDSGITVFGPGETKVGYFDFSLVRSLGSPLFAPGTYRVTAAFGGKAVTLETVVLGP